jgi:hypothetical protein
MAGDVQILRRKGDNCCRDIKYIVNILMSRGFISESLDDKGDCYSFYVNKPDYDDDFRWYLDDRSSWAIMYIDIIKREHSYCWEVEDSSGKKIDYYRYVYIEGSGDRGFLYLNFLHEYFKLFPEDIFKGEADYLYTKEDIDRIYEKEIWLGNWYGLDPKT